MKRPNASFPSQKKGVTLLVLLFIVAIAGVMLSKQGLLWSTLSQREKEQQLLWVGNAYRQAIQNYYEQSPTGVKQYPISLEELIKDSRVPYLRRYIRKLYNDPITGEDFELLQTPDNRIYGIRSTSSRAPIKQGNFGLRDTEFANKNSYQEWVFKYVPDGVTIAPPPVSDNGVGGSNTPWKR